MNDNGQLSIDFLIGFTIFMLGLIMVANMIPGLMIGLRRNIAIDYDAVAYRTGAILAEDPGWSSNDDPNWEYASNPIDIQRFGLAISKDTPNVLSLTKIEKFNGTGISISYPNDYRRRLIFGDYPYRFNITIREKDGTQFFIGEPLPDLPSYGYIRRIVRIKPFAETTIDFNGFGPSNETVGAIFGPLNGTYNATCFNCSDVTQTFATRLNFTELINPGINPAFQFNPLVEPIIIHINNFSEKFNWSSINSNGTFPFEFPAAANDSMWKETLGYYPDNATFYATLKEIKFSLWDPNKPIGFQYADLPLPPIGSYIFNYSDLTGEHSKDFGADGQVNISVYQNSNITLIIYPSAFSGMPEILTGTSVLDIRFIFSDAPPHTLVNGVFPIDYRTINSTKIQDGWIEVAVW